MQRTGKESGFPVQVCEHPSLGLGIPSHLADTRYFYDALSSLCYLLQVLRNSLPWATGKSINKGWRPCVEIGGSREEANPGWIRFTSPLWSTLAEALAPAVKNQLNLGKKKKIVARHTSVSHMKASRDLQDVPITLFSTTMAGSSSSMICSFIMSSNVLKLVKPESSRPRYWSSYFHALLGTFFLTVTLKRHCFITKSLN